MINCIVTKMRAISSPAIDIWRYLELNYMTNALEVFNKFSTGIYKKKMPIAICALVAQFGKNAEL